MQTRSRAILLAAGSGALAFMMGCGSATSEAPPLTPVRLGNVQTIDTAQANTYSANIQPYEQVDLAFKSGGYVASIRQVKDANGHVRNIDQGDYVSKGTVLATVQQDDYQQKLTQANSQLTRAQADRDRAKLSFDRMSALYQAGAATKPDYDNANAQYQSAQASVDSAQAQIAEAKIALGYTELRAPFNSWVVKRNVDVGALVGPATNGFSLANTRSVKAVFGVPDVAIGNVPLGSAQTITTDSLPGSFNGHVTSISPSADPKSRVFSVEVTIDNPADRLKSGMIASITITGQRRGQRVMVVPLTAIVRNPAEPKAFAVLVAEMGANDTAKVHLQNVSLGDAYGNLIAVQSGIGAGDRVVTSGATMVHNGDTVRVVP
jgi:multidrug efflux system membrane fusion protein